MKTYGISVDALTLPRYTGVERYVFSLLKKPARTQEQSRRPTFFGREAQLFVA